MTRFRVLSLDGGGIRGAFTAAFLAELEREINRPIGRYFDLVAGTSTGGIIALAVALGVPAQQVVEFYRNAGPKVFGRRPPLKAGLLGIVIRLLLGWKLGKHGVKYDDLLRSKYDATQLKSALEDVFGSKTLLDARTRAVIPAVDLSRGCTVVFKTPHLHDANTRDRNFRVVDLALATSAAPTYFPHATIRTGSAYCDGGLWANNPVLVAIAEVLRLREDSVHGFEGLQILSIGTGLSRYSHAPPDGAGLVWWGPRIVDVTSLSQAEGALHAARFMLGTQLHRVDFALPDDTWQLDSVQHIDQLIHIGTENAHCELARLRGKYLDVEAEEQHWRRDADTPRVCDDAATSEPPMC